jgi:tetratricopeptide (TPR) repeat protein
MIDDSYIMMGKATFYKGQFLESIGLFSYVALKYAGEDAWYLANLWIARAYAEMGWLYEAENMLTLVNDENLPYQYVKFYNIVSADFRIKRGEYQAAVPFLKSALESHFKRDKRQRFEFILGQLYQELGQDDLAYDYYKGVVRSIPTYEMELYARIRMTEVMVDDDSRRAIKKLKKMLKNPKNLEYQGQIYYALGNIYTKTNNSTLAIENYRLSLAFSTGLQQGVTSHTIAKLYWDDRDYRGAQPYYSTAASALPADYTNGHEISYRAEVLSQLSAYYSVMGDTDREYVLSQMTEAEKQDFLNKEARAAVRKEEILAIIAIANGKVEEEESIAEDRKEVVTGGWYFYNYKLVESGKDEFRKQWGDRALKDNWRRIMAQDFSEPDYIAEEEENTDESVDNKTTLVAEDTVPSISNEAKEKAERMQKAASNKAIVDAYFNLAAVYQYDIEDYDKAIATYEALEALFPNNPHSPDSYFAIYNASNETGNAQKAEAAKQTLLREYPESNYALILSDPNAKEILLTDKEAYNKLYEETFELFLNGKNHEVLANTRQLNAEFRDSTLLPNVV